MAAPAGHNALRRSGSACGSGSRRADSSALGGSPCSGSALAARSTRGIGDRHRGDQRSACRDAAARRTAPSAGAISIDLAEIQHDDAVADMAHHREIVRDEQIGQAEPLLQVDQQVDDLRLDVDVERRDRLVGDDEIRAPPPARARSRCAAAGRRRIRADSVAPHWRGRPTSVEQLVDARRGAAAASPAMPWKRSGSARISPTVMRGLSDAYGSWKTICMRRRSGRIVDWRGVGDVLCRRRRIVPAVGLVDARDQPRERRLAAAGLADQADGLAAADREVDAIDGVHARAGLREEASPSAAESASRRPRDLAASAPPAAARRGAATAGRGRASRRRQRPPSCVTQQRALRARRPLGSSSGCSVALLDAERAARRESGSRWARRSGSGGVPSMVISRRIARPCAIDARHGVAAAPRCRDGADR